MCVPRALLRSLSVWLAGRPTDRPTVYLCPLRVRPRARARVCACVTASVFLPVYTKARARAYSRVYTRHRRGPRSKLRYLERQTGAGGGSRTRSARYGRTSWRSR